jgi:uncharacterized protein (UPF0332 family)
MFDWADYLVLAQELALHTSEEACLRSAVSRAYYSVFCTARDWLRHNVTGIVIPETGEAHKAVWDAFKNWPVADWQEIGQEGSRLRAQRGQVDYDGNLPLLRNFVPVAMERARLLRANLAALPPPQ